MVQFKQWMSIFVIAFLGIPTSFAQQVDFVFKHNPATGARISQEIYLFVDVHRIPNGTFADHSASTPKGGLPVGGSSVDNVRTSVFSSDLSGIYSIKFNCGLSRDEEQAQAVLRIERRVPKSGTVFLDISCPVDEEGLLTTPTFKYTVKTPS
jgi:hypothetical protein